MALSFSAAQERRSAAARTRLPYRFIVSEDLANGTLVEVMRNYGGASRPFNLLYPPHRHMPLRVRVLVEFLLKNLRDKQREGRASSEIL